jgi:hypothetical protein
MPPCSGRWNGRAGKAGTASMVGIASDASGAHRQGEDSVSAEERLKHAEELLDRLERTRTRLEETKDPDEAIEILSELAEIAKEVESQLQQAKREAEA